MQQLTFVCAAKVPAVPGPYTEGNRTFINMCVCPEVSGRNRYSIQLQKPVLEAYKRLLPLSELPAVLKLAARGQLAALPVDMLKDAVKFYSPGDRHQGSKKPDNHTASVGPLLPGTVRVNRLVCVC